MDKFENKQKQEVNIKLEEIKEVNKTLNMIEYIHKTKRISELKSLYNAMCNNITSVCDFTSEEEQQIEKIFL